ncbi:hypothetical protein [Aldersonia kunmingensis]|uniref:hypothetical protein n=1 Tax=Aldersonia kunmingensis TaxID=408066 RepID=UPI00082ADC43|nr:hypothetical protein [Aldersonia kunmingensis]
MKLTRIAASTSMALATAVAAAGIAQAAPAPSPNPVQQEIRYNTKLVDKTVVTTLDGGTFKIADDKRTFEIKDEAGNAVVRMPLSFTLDSISHPVSAKVEADGTVLELTPDMDIRKARPVFVKPVASPVEDQRALSQFSSYLGVGTSIGTFLGTAAGVVVGAVIGCAAGFVIGCLPAAAPFAAIGGIIGMVAVGGPVVAYSAIELVNTLMAKPGTSKYADKTYNVAPKSGAPAAPKKPAAEELPAADSEAPEAVPAG